MVRSIVNIRTKLPAAAIASMILLQMSVVAPTASSATPSPAASAADFYPVPSPLPSGSPGDVIWQRPLTGGAALPAAGTNTLVLYHTISASGRDVAVSGVISLPKGAAPASGWPVISWTHGTTGNAPQCAPSKSRALNVEQRFVDGFVGAGYAAVQTDYEGEGTPEIHPYFAALSSAHDAIDIVRAARHIYPSLSDRWLAMGHSEGGAAAIFAAQEGPRWAPQLHLAGAVALAPGANIGTFLHNLHASQEPTPMLVLLAMMIAGIASSDPSIDLRSLLSDRALALMPTLRQRCADDLMAASSWTTMPPSRFFRPESNIGPLMQAFVKNDPDLARVGVPLLLVQGTDDTIVPLALSNGLNYSLCLQGTSLQYDRIDGATHDTVMPISAARVQTWVAERFAGKRMRSTCEH